MGYAGKYRGAPDPNQKGMPGGIPYIIGNEAAERFSFYGMKAILTVFMTEHLLDAAGHSANMSEEEAKGVYHLFTAAAYFFPIMGAVVADAFLGKYRTILFISLMYCLGHGALAMMDVGPATGGWGMRPFLFAGLILVAIGAGGIKPCVSAHVGDQFGSGNKRLVTQVFNWFYFSINVGAAASTMLTPVLLKEVGPAAAFGLPGVLMAIATFVFWLGRDKFIHVPPSGWNKFVEETFSPDGRRALINLAPLFLIFVPMFWAMFDQTGSAWVLQGDKMNRDLGFVWLPAQIQAVNPLMILIGIPVFTYVVYPFMGRFFEPTPLRKIGIGLVLTALSFSVSALVEQRIEQRQAAIASEMTLAIVEDARAFELADDPEVATEERKAWTKAARNAELVGMDAAAMAELVGLSLEEFETARDTDGLEVSHSADIIAAIVSEAYRTSPKTLNAAVKAARAAPERAGWDEPRIVGFLGLMPSIIWQFLAYLILTSGEIMVSIVCLEFAYTQSPRRMKSFIMGVYFLGVSLGNVFVSGVNFVLEWFRSEDGSTPLEGANYYWFFTGLMVITILIYVVFARTYKGQSYFQGEKDDPAGADDS